jgi:hypothetical protein
MNAPVELVQALVSGDLFLGEARSAGGLTLVPVLGSERGEPGYVLAADGFAEGALTIGEIGAGSVPQLVVQNRGDRPALLIDGEHLEGAKQNRVLNVTVLVAARRDTVIPVSCVEQGRWSYGADQGFAPSPEVAHSLLRGGTAQSHMDHIRAGLGHVADQAAVWNEVDRKRDEVGAAWSPTHAMRDLFEDRRAELSEMTEAFEAPERDQVGVVACVGGRPLVADIFGHPSILARLWPRLVAGYAMDALGHPLETVDPSAVESMLAAVLVGEATTHDDLGLGTEVMVKAPEVVANALTWQGEVVHLAVFSVESPGGGQRSHTDPGRSTLARRLGAANL